jgi:colicin import membrane protein
MIRSRENPVAVKAGALALVMHAVFLTLMVISFSWKHTQPPLAAQVELWDSLPQPKMETPPPEVKPEPPPPPVEPEIKPEPKPEPPPPPEPKAEIQVKPKPPVPEVKKPPKEEPKKPDPALKKQEEEKKRLEEKKLELERLKKAMLNDLPEQHDETADTKKVSDAKAAADARAAADAKRAADMLAASSGVVDEYKAKIVAKIKRYVNKEVCGTGKPELLFAIALIPSGEVSGSPRLLKSSGIAACDQAVERAILQAQPLPLPPQSELFSQFRDLNLKFRPNE